MGYPRVSRVDRVTAWWRPVAGQICVKVMLHNIIHAVHKKKVSYCIFLANSAEVSELNPPDNPYPYPRVWVHSHHGYGYGLTLRYPRVYPCCSLVSYSIGLNK